MTPTHHQLQHPQWTLTQLLTFLTTITITGILWSLWPTTLGGNTSWIIVAGNSMEPTFNHGDLLLIQKQNHYQQGDIITFKIPADQTGANLQIVHRITGYHNPTQTQYITQGDNRDYKDYWRPTNTDITGKTKHVIPAGGNLIRALTNPFYISLLAGITAATAILLTPTNPPPETHTQLYR